MPKRFPLRTLLLMVLALAAVVRMIWLLSEGAMSEEPASVVDHDLGAGDGTVVHPVPSGRAQDDLPSDGFIEDAPRSTAPEQVPGDTGGGPGRP